MELKEGLEFYRKCLEHCDMVIANEHAQIGNYQSACPLYGNSWLLYLVKAILYCLKSSRNLNIQYPLFLTNLTCEDNRYFRKKTGENLDKSEFLYNFATKLQIWISI